MEAGHKKNVFFLELLRVCDEWRGEYEDWVLVEKGSGKNVENVDVVLIVVERKVRFTNCRC